MAKKNGNEKDQIGTQDSTKGAYISNQWTVKSIFRWPNGYQDNAIPHDLIRGELLSAAEERWAWAHDQPRGAGLNDRTSPHPEQLSWAWDPPHYPEIIFVLRKYGYQNPAYEVPFWYHKGRLVLSMDGRPMRKLLHLPDVCSSKLPGGHIEALMRLDDRTTYRDLYGRMPKEEVIVKNEGPYLKPLRDIRSLISSARRFRERVGCLNWGDHFGIDLTNRWILMHLPDELKAINTTRGWQASGRGKQPAKPGRRQSICGVSSKRGIQVEPAQNASWRLQQACFSSPFKGYSENDDIEPSHPNTDHNENVDYDQHEQFDPQLDVEYTDSRRDYPEDDSTVLDLRSAMTATFIDFFHQIGRLPLSYPYLSYVEQYKRIQQEFDDIYLRIGGKKTPPPMLVQLTYWTGGISSWRSAYLWDTNTKKAYQIEGNGGKGREMLSEYEESTIRWSEDEIKRSPFDPNTFECGSALFDSTEVPVHPRTQNYGRNLECRDDSEVDNLSSFVFEDDPTGHCILIPGTNEDGSGLQVEGAMGNTSPADFHFELEEGYDKENLHRGSTVEARQRILQGGGFFTDDGRLAHLDND